MKTLLLPLKLFIFNVSRKVNRAFILPINYTYSVTSRCESRCKTCNIWKHSPKDDLTKDEWKRIIRSIGKAPYWITVTGGNQFLRKDLVDIIEYIIRYNQPKIINFPVNGSKKQATVVAIRKILELLKRKSVKLIVNLSIDGIGQLHDNIRGVKSEFTNSIETFRELQKLQEQYDNLLIGTYTVISRYNISSVEEIVKYLREELKPDSYSIEFAEQRVELDNLKMNFVPNKKERLLVLENLITNHQGSRRFLMKCKDYLRKKYHITLRKHISKGGEVTKCFAGIASIQIAPNGTVWQCCTKATPLGNLRENDYDFRRIFFGERADLVRKQVKTENCFCGLSNSYYTNLLSSFLRSG